MPCSLSSLTIHGHWLLVLLDDKLLAGRHGGFGLLGGGLGGGSEKGGVFEVVLVLSQAQSRSLSQKTASNARTTGAYQRWQYWLIVASPKGQPLCGCTVKRKELSGLGWLQASQQVEGRHFKIRCRAAIKTPQQNLHTRPWLLQLHQLLQCLACTNRKTKLVIERVSLRGHTQLSLPCVCVVDLVDDVLAMVSKNFYELHETCENLLFYSYLGPRYHFWTCTTASDHFAPTECCVRTCYN